MPHRRRREKKTDYDQRLKLLKSGKLRLVVRKHSRNTVAQIISWSEEGDRTLVQAEAQDLRKYGWKGHCGNLPAAYLTGYLLGGRAKGEGIERAILDVGLQDRTKGNRIYAVVKGARDGGLTVPAGESVLPSEDRIEGKHIEEYAAKVNDRGKRFSNLTERGLDPELISDHFKQIKDKIKEEFGAQNA